MFNNAILLWKWSINPDTYHQNEIEEKIIAHQYIICINQMDNDSWIIRLMYHFVALSVANVTAVCVHIILHIAIISRDVLTNIQLKKIWINWYRLWFVSFHDMHYICDDRVTLRSRLFSFWEHKFLFFFLNKKIGNG